MKKKNLIIVVMTIVMSLLLVACQTNPTDLPVENPTGTEAPSPTETPSVPDTNVDDGKTTEGSEDPTVVPSPTEPVEPSPTPEPTETPSIPDTSEDDDKTTEGSTETPTPTPEPEPTPTPEPHKHSYVEKVTKPTCTEKGYTDYICECGDSYVGNPIDALGHSFTSYVYNNDATIEKDGTKTAKCNNSNCTFTDTVPAPGTQKPLTFDGTENHYRWATSKVTVRDFPSSNGNVIGTVNVNDSVYIVDRCIETDYFKIKYGDGYGYVKNNMDLTLTDPNAPEPTPEPEPKPEPYDGYDEFGNGYRWGQRGGETVKLFDVDCPYDITKVYEESSTVLYVYGLQGMPGKLLDANAMLEERYGVYSIIENESIVLGYYNGKKVTINYARYLGQYNH